MRNYSEIAKVKCDAVVPYHREAAAAAGFNVLRLIHEPSAALLAYGIGQDSPTGKR